MLDPEAYRVIPNLLTVCGRKLYLLALKGQMQPIILIFLKSDCATRTSLMSDTMVFYLSRFNIFIAGRIGNTSTIFRLLWDKFTISVCL